GLGWRAGAFLERGAPPDRPRLTRRLIGLTLSMIPVVALYGLSRSDWRSLDLNPWILGSVALALFGAIRFWPRLACLRIRLGERAVLLVLVGSVATALPFGYALFRFADDPRVPGLVMEQAPLAHGLVPVWRRWLDRDGDGYAALLGGG